MKKIIYLLMIIPIAFASCEVEKLDNPETLKAVKSTATLKECKVIDADRCPFGDRQPTANFWWPENETDYFNPTAYFSSTEDHKLTFTEYDNGTALIQGFTVQGTCVVEVNVWLKNGMSWDDWSAAGGGHKKEGCAGDVSNSEDMTFYIIDSEESWIEATGGDCLGTGKFGVEQRPDPSDMSTPNYGAHVGPGGANYDSNIGAIGLSTWGWITDLDSGDRLWVMDFNFLIDCEVKEPACETAFAFSGDQDDCFLKYDFNRWGWVIPVSEGTSASYDVYAGAGQCDLGKGAFVGTVEINYVAGNFDIQYNIDPAYDVEEIHTYAGSTMFPTNKKGKPTVAPGQYTIAEDLNGDIYVIAHVVVCN